MENKGNDMSKKFSYSTGGIVLHKLNLIKVPFAIWQQEYLIVLCI